MQLLVNHFILFLLIIFSQIIITHEKMNRIRIFLTRNFPNTRLMRDQEKT